MINTKFIIDGKGVNPGQVEDEFLRERMIHIKIDAIEKIGSLKCPEHGEATEIIYTQIGNSLKFETSACCANFLQTFIGKMGE